MRKLILATAIAFAGPTAACAQPAAQAQPKPGAPRLLIVISVDQLAGDLFDEYRPHFTGGLARLAGGTVYRNGYQAHAATETCPGHSTILTGVHPAKTGIIANNWMDQSIARPVKSVYCAEDERLPAPNPAAAQGTAGSYAVSPAHLRARTLGDLLKERSPASLNVAVAGKDRSAVMLSGHRADQRWYWDGSKFATDLKGAVPPSLSRANAAVAATIAAAREPLAPPPVCQAKSAPVAVSPTLTVGNGRFARIAGDSRGYRTSPELDGATLAVAAGLIQDLRLGADAAPDILSIGLAATDYVGHAYGTGGQEMCLQLLSLDRDLGDFLRLLDSWRLNYAVVLTADHGSPDIPERLRLRGVTQAARVDPALTGAEVSRAIGARLGLTGQLILGDFFGDMWINAAVPAEHRPRVLREALALYRRHPQVEAAFTADEIRRVRLPSGRPDRWSVAQRLRASFDPQRSGDIIVALKPFIVPIPDTSRGYVATHGSPWDYDRRVPILFWRAGMRSSMHQEPVSTVDILPTVAPMLGLSVPRSIDGRCRSVQGVTCPSR